MQSRYLSIPNLPEQPTQGQRYYSDPTFYNPRFFNNSIQININVLPASIPSAIEEKPEILPKTFCEKLGNCCAGFLRKLTCG